MSFRSLIPALVVGTLLFSVGLAAADTTQMWADQYDGGGNFIDSGTLVTLAPDGNLVVAGESSEATGGADLYLRKLDRSNAQQLWDFRFDGIDDKDVAVSEMTWDSVGQLLVAGFIRGCVG